MKKLILIVVVTACGGNNAPVAWDRLAASEAVKVLKAPDSPYYNIYYPPVDLRRK